MKKYTYMQTGRLGKGTSRVCDEWLIAVSDDHLKVVLEMKSGKPTEDDSTRRVEGPKYSELQRSMRITTRMRREVNTIIGVLRDIGVSNGIDAKEIVRACRCKQPGSYTIARGIEPIRGKHGEFLPDKNWASMTISQAGQGITAHDRSNAGQEPREMLIKKGDSIGVIHMPVPGQPGLSVYGTSIPPPEVYPIRVIVGQGISIDKMNNRVIADKDGQPLVKRQGYTITIRMKGCDLLDQEIRQLAAGLYKQIGSMLIVMEQLLQFPVFERSYDMHIQSGTGLSSMIKLLCQDSYQSVPDLSVSLIANVNQTEYKLDDRWGELCAKLYNNFVMTDLSDLNTLVELRELITQLELICTAESIHDVFGAAYIPASYMRTTTC